MKETFYLVEATSRERLYFWGEYHDPRRRVEGAEIDSGDGIDGDGRGGKDRSGEVSGMCINDVGSVRRAVGMFLGGGIIATGWCMYGMR